MTIYHIIRRQQGRDLVGRLGIEPSSQGFGDLRITIFPDRHKTIYALVNSSGLEPETCGLKGRCSTIELGVLAGAHGLEPRLTESKSAVLPIRRSPTVIGGAAGENRTPNLLITNQLPYHWATAA